MPKDKTKECDKTRRMNMMSSEECSSRWYDHIKGITNSLGSLNDLICLFQARYEAGYERGEKLEEYYVLGRWYLDGCGNCGKISDWIPKEKFPDIPSVLTKSELFAFIRKRIGGWEKVFITSGINSDLPRNGVVCPVCQKGWDIENCHDTIIARSTEVIPFSEFVGETLGMVKARYKFRSDAFYFMQPDIIIRNDRYIDRDNTGGWLNEKSGITDGYIIQNGDEGHFNVWRYYHSQCNLENLEFLEKK